MRQLKSHNEVVTPIGKLSMGNSFIILLIGVATENGCVRDSVDREMDAIESVTCEAVRGVAAYKRKQMGNDF